MTASYAQSDGTCAAKLAYLRNRTGSQFQLGTSIAMVGDIDRNGLNDIAVGVPMDSHDGNFFTGVWYAGGFHTELYNLCLHHYI